MTDIFTRQLTATLEAVFGVDGFTTWVEPLPPSLGRLSHRQSDLLLAGMRLLNWGFPRLNIFLRENFAITSIENLPASQIDAFFDQLNEAIADWKDNKIDGCFEGASLSSLSSKYWEARLALYPQAVPASKNSKKRKKWLLDGYQPPEYKVKPPPDPETKPDPDPEPPDDWVDPMEPLAWYLPA